MSWKRRGWTLIGMVLLALPGALVEKAGRALAQTSGVATTTIADTIYRADGTAAGGTVLVSWPSFTTPTGQSVSGGSTSVTLGTGGSLNVSLAANAGAMPMGSYYTAVFHLDDGTVSREYWVVPVSQYPVKLTGIRSTVLPTAMAMQTVSKGYVDTAIAAAVAGHPLISSNPYVLKAGDSMTGALGLPGDPTLPNQAADKNYVDENITALTTGLGQKVSTMPAGTQIVTQPAATQLSVNKLNGAEYASQYQTNGINGILNATTSSDCVNGCDVKADRSYTSNENMLPAAWNSTGTGGTHLEDTRGGARLDYYLNPYSVLQGGTEVGQQVDVTGTLSTVDIYKASSSPDPASIGMVIHHHGVTGGNNIFPENVGAAFPYFKTGYSALGIDGTYNTAGQHVLVPQSIHCYGVGDCLLGGQFITASGGFRDNADEATHPYDLQIQEDANVFQGTCGTGCTTGSTQLMVYVSNNPGTQGEGRFLIDKNPAKVLSTGTLTGQAAPGPGAAVAFSGTSFPVSVFLQAATLIPAQANNMAPGTVTVPIQTTNVPSGFVTSTGALPQTSGVACVVDPRNGGAHNYEMANYSVVDSTHVQLALNKPHITGATIAVGGLCGYGLEQTVDTLNGIRQVFPVIGSYSATGLYYAGGHSQYVGLMGYSSAYLNVNMTVAAISRTNNVVTVTTSGNLPVDVNGLTMTVAGVADTSYNGSFAVTTTGSNTLTYASSGVNSTSSGGSVAAVTGGFALYPMAEVLGVFNASTKQVDGAMTLAANTVPWAANDPVEEPHYYEEAVAADTMFVGQTTPRPAMTQGAGIQYQVNVGPGIHGWQIANAASASSYLGNGGTHVLPEVAFEAIGPWHRTMTMQAGDESVFNVHCNSHGCGRWNSGYNVFEFDNYSGGDVISYQPQTSSMTFRMGGASYGFSSQGFSAGTVNATTVNATTINASQVNGAVSPASLPVFAPSGTSHAQGAVPDPGSVAGKARYLREDGTWINPVTPVAVASTVAPTASTVLTTFGDSIVAGTGASSTATDQAQLTANAMGAYLNNYALGGDQACDVFTRQIWPNHVSTTVDSSAVYELGVGTNDVDVKGTGPYEAVFESCHQAAMAWLGVPREYKVLGGDAGVTATGAWSATVDTTDASAFGGLHASGAGTVTFPVTSYGNPVYVWYTMQDNVAGANFTYSLDGGAQSAAYYTSPTPAIATQNGSTYSVGLIRIPAAAGAHSVMLTTTTGSVIVQGVGTMPSKAYAGHAVIAVSDVPNQLAGSALSTPQQIAQYTSDISTDAALLDADGADVRVVHTEQYMMATAAEMYNNLHPNDFGYTHMASAYKAVLNPTPATVYGTRGYYTSNTTGGNETYAFVSCPGACNYTLPALPRDGRTITVNAFIGNSGTVVVLPPAGGGLFTTSNAAVPSYTIANGKSATFANFVSGSTDNWILLTQ